VQCGRFGKELQISLKHPQHSINISNRIVDVKGDANTVVTAGEYDIFFGLSDARRVAFPNSVNAGSVAWLARNQLLLKAVQAVRSQMERIMYAAIDIGYYGELPVDEHCHIVEAIVKREPTRARQLMYDHTFGSRAKVIEIAGGGAHGQWETS